MRLVNVIEKLLRLFQKVERFEKFNFLSTKLEGFFQSMGQWGAFASSLIHLHVPACPASSEAEWC